MKVISHDALPLSVIAREFVGEDHDADVTFVMVDAPPGAGPRLHRHPYAEVIIVQEGEATFRVGDRELVVRAGEIVVVAAGEPHAFTNTGAGALRQIDIHASRSFATEWLEEPGDE